MREILFRGKRVDNGEWIEGYFLPGNERKSLHPCIFVYLPETQSFECFDIDIDTLGEYTGLTDKNGTRIFEGDILGYSEQSELRYLNNVRFVVLYDNLNACFVVERYVNGNYKLQKRLATFNPSKHLEVIGNVYDNPELLKGD